jgi:hypothetical protein
MRQFCAGWVGCNELVAPLPKAVGLESRFSARIFPQFSAYRVREEGVFRGFLGRLARFMPKNLGFSSILTCFRLVI